VVAEADEVTRRPALRLADDDLLPEDMARDLAMHGCTVVPLDASEVDGAPGRLRATRGARAIARLGAHVLRL